MKMGAGGHAAFVCIAFLTGCASTPETLQQQRIRPALAKFESLVTATQSGRNLSLPWQADLAAEYSRAAAETDPFFAELHRRFADGQTWRGAAFNADSRVVFTAGLSPEDAEAAQKAAIERVAEHDIASTAWLKAKVAARGGWFRKSDVGADHARMAFMLAQHADRTPDFQAEALAMMESLLPAGEVEARSYALLWDRVAVRRNAPQRYGSQGECQGKAWRPRPMEAPGDVDRRRADVGLQPLAEYTAMMSRDCARS